MRHINGQLPEKYGGSSTAVYENADGALLKALVNGFLPGMILYSFPRNTTAPFSLTSVSMTLTIRCWAKASFSTMWRRKSCIQNASGNGFRRSHFCCLGIENFSYHSHYCTIIVIFNEYSTWTFLIWRFERSVHELAHTESSHSKSGVDEWMDFYGNMPWRSIYASSCLLAAKDPGQKPAYQPHVQHGVDRAGGDGAASGGAAHKGVVSEAH
mgnify:CR=1 FL=1